MGAELRALLEESRFAGADLRLVDEEIVAGTLTVAGGEAAVIRPVEDDSFMKADMVLFSGSASFAQANLELAKSSGAKIVDLSGGFTEQKGAVSWFGKLDALLGREFPKETKSFGIPSAGATAAAALALAWSKVGLRKMSLVCMQSVSEAGRAGIEELETQTGQLLSFQSAGRPVFDTQVAFNMVDRFGAASAQKLEVTRERLRAETKACIGEKHSLVALQLLQAPVFYGTAFSACAELENGDAEKIIQSCKDAGFAVAEEGGVGPSNVSAAGERNLQLSRPESDPGQSGSWWFWGAADNIRVPAANALKLAEMLL